MAETQLTSGPGGRLLTNVNVWSPNGQWVVYDTRSDAAGEVFDGTRIEAVHVRTKEVRVLYESKNGARCGVATWHPKDAKVAFILGPENPTPDWTYGPSRRQGVVVAFDKPGVAANLDARDLVPPFTPGALRGGSHVHVWDTAGEWVSFTYEDHVVSRFATDTPAAEANLRTVAVAVPAGAVKVSHRHSRNHDGSHFCVVAAVVTSNPRPGSDEIKKAFEEGWVGPRTLAFQGHVVTAAGDTISEVFLAELPADVRAAGDGPLQGTETRRPRPPKGATQRRLTYTAGRKYPGLQGPRHWLRASPDGSRIACLMKDDGGVPQLWTLSPRGGSPTQVTRVDAGIASAFTWSPCGKRVFAVSGGRVAAFAAATGEAKYLTELGGEVRPEACAASPDGRRVTFVWRVGGVNQICTADMPA